MPLYRVILNGLNISSVVPVYKVYHRIPNFDSGTADPDPANYEEGDVYFKFID